MDNATVAGMLVLVFAFFALLYKFCRLLLERDSLRSDKNKLGVLASLAIVAGIKPTTTVTELNAARTAREALEEALRVGQEAHQETLDVERELRGSLESSEQASQIAARTAREALESMETSKLEAENKLKKYDSIIS